jgi:RNA polymerase sigma-70 factor, ECF subfamily
MVDAAFGRELVAALPKLRRFAFGLAGSIDEGDDLVQAACERALARRDQYEPGTRLVNWMYRIVQRVWIDRLGWREPTMVDLLTVADFPGGDALEAESRLVLAKVRLAIAGLPPDQRTVLLLVSVEGVAYREAAEILGLPIDTVMSGLARARLALSRVLEDSRGGSEPKGGSAKVIKLC